MDKTSYKGKCLYNEDLLPYLVEKYGTDNIMLLKEGEIAKYPKLLQNDYGDANDCTITSITSVICYLTNNKYSVNKVYDDVVAVATKYFYNGKKSGTNPIFVRKIMAELAKKYGIKKTSSVKYLTRIMYGFNTVIELINKNTPMVLNLFKDGRDYYYNHSITITGYKVFSVNGKYQYFMQVQDNWHKKAAFVDFNLLGIISSINYYK